MGRPFDPKHQAESEVRARKWYLNTIAKRDDTTIARMREVCDYYENLAIQQENTIHLLEDRVAKLEAKLRDVRRVSSAHQPSDDSDCG